MALLFLISFVFVGEVEGGENDTSLGLLVYGARLILLTRVSKHAKVLNRALEMWACIGLPLYDNFKDKTQQKSNISFVKGKLKISVLIH